MRKYFQPDLGTKVGSDSSSELNSDDEERIVFNKDLDMTNDIRERERLSEQKVTSMQSP